MSAQTNVSAKGQVVIPKDVRDRLNFLPGTRLDVIETSGGVLLKVARPRRTATFEECEARIRQAVRYSGPRYTPEQEREAIGEMFKSGRH